MKTPEPNLNSGISREKPKGFMEIGPNVLAPRETQVARLAGSGRSNSEIAAILGISVDTVEVHRRNIFKKLNIHNASDLTRWVIANLERSATAGEFEEDETLP